MENDLVNLVKKAFPALKIREYRVISLGWDNYIVLINEETAFKIPRKEENITQLLREAKVLNCMFDSPIAVPRFLYKKRFDHRVIAGYRYIKGDPINSISRLTDLMKTQLSEFLNYLYAKKNDPCIVGLFGNNNSKSWENRYVSFLKELSSNLSGVLDDHIFVDFRRKFEIFLEEYCTSLTISPTHGDLYKGNIIIDDTHKEIKGIIDWGDFAIGDPALDFAALAVDFPIDQIEEIISNYSGLVDRNFRNRLEFYWQIEPVYAILHSLQIGAGSIETEMEILTERLDLGLF